MVIEIRFLDVKLKANADAIAELVQQSKNTLTETIGIGPVTAAHLIDRTGYYNQDRRQGLDLVASGRRTGNTRRARVLTPDAPAGALPCR